MAKGKYTPEKVETILKVLRATGSDKAVILDPEILNQNGNATRLIKF
jgi:hypothetical protein